MSCLSVGIGMSARHRACIYLDLNLDFFIKILSKTCPSSKCIYSNLNLTCLSECGNISGCQAQSLHLSHKCAAWRVVTFSSKMNLKINIKKEINKLAKARKTRTSPGTLCLKKFGLGKPWVKKVFGKYTFKKYTFRKYTFGKYTF